MANTGRLTINVFDKAVANPLEGATVQVVEEGGEQIVEEVSTDSQGKTAVLELPCPPLEYSMEYNENFPRPYSRYNLQVVRDGFDPQVISGVEVFYDTTAIQDVLLEPAPQNNLREGVITIGDNTLYGIYLPKIPESPVKPLPSPSGNVVLNEPVIPETIVVHAGKPNDNTAPNYYVPFKDYIKNVASCEIYSTWPVATLKANILCILSFTLNRVFTEWYRNLGKNFTITSSTAYDHAFTYGRNIYEEISVVVDELFTTYITKPNIMQPLFTQYCDGSRVTCPNWLSQWGSKNLGDQGHDYLYILKNYYGSDIYLSQAEKVLGIPQSYPGDTLQLGSVGDAVRTIQRQLNTIANNYPAVGKLVEDGIYGQSTMNAVKVFQKVFHLPESGVVDLPTWYKISAIYVAVTKMAELQ